MIARDTLLRVRETARIDEVAAGYLTLRRSGKDLVALCPFHDERHPSFRISPALNIGKCFSCGEAAGRKGGPDAGGIREVLGEIRLVGSPLAVYRRMEELSKATGIPLDVLREELSASPGEPVRTGPAEVVTGLPPARLRERALLRFCLANHDRMFYAGDGSGISLPAWVASELSAGGMPLTEPAHLDLLTLLSGGGHPDGITDESLSALILSLRSSYPEEGPPERLPDELLPDEAERQLFLYAEPFIHDRLQRTAARLRSATSTGERAACLGELRDCFALSDRIGRVLGSQSVRRVEG